MDVERLVQMANDIGDYFGSDPDREAGITGMRNHLERFWAPRMRRRIITHLADGGDGLGAIARAAIGRLEMPPGT